MEHKNPTRAGGKHACPRSFPVSRSGSSQRDVISWSWGRWRRGWKEAQSREPASGLFISPFTRQSASIPVLTGGELEVRRASDRTGEPQQRGQLRTSTSALPEQREEDAGRYHGTPKPPQPGRWTGSARLPARQQTNQAESMASAGSSAPASVVFVSNVRGAMPRLCRETGERAARLCSLWFLVETPEQPFPALP